MCVCVCVCVWREGGGEGGEYVCVGYIVLKFDRLNLNNVYSEL